MNSSLRLSVIILNWNVCDLLRNCLRSFYENIQLSDDIFEVIVVDNDSQDQSKAMLRLEFPQVILIEHDSNPGYGRGCESGYALARGDYVWLLNPDTLILDDAVTTLLSRFDAEPRLGVLGPRLLNGDRTLQRAAAGAFPTLWNTAWNYFFLRKLLPQGWAPAPIFLEQDIQGTFTMDWVSGAAMMMRREALGDYVADDAFFKYADDLDISERVRKRGWKVKYTSDCSIVHFQGRSLQHQTDPDILMRAHKGGPRRFFGRHRGLIACFAYDSMVIFGHLIRWLLYSTLAIINPSGRYSKMTAFSKQYILTMLRALWRRG